MTSDDLAQFRAQFPDCELAVLADLPTATVLAWDSPIKQPQERLDALCDTARDIFADAGSPYALMVTGTGTRLFLQAGSDLLCGVFAPAADIRPAIRAGRALLEAGKA